MLNVFEKYGGEVLSWAKNNFVQVIISIKILYSVRLHNMDLINAKMVSLFHSKQLVVKRPVFFDHILDLVMCVLLYMRIRFFPIVVVALVPAFLVLRDCIRSSNVYVWEDAFEPKRTRFREIKCITWDMWAITIYHEKGKLKNLFLNGRYSYACYAGVFEFVDEAKRNGVPVYKDDEEEMMRKRINPFLDDTNIEL